MALQIASSSCWLTSRTGQQRTWPTLAGYPSTLCKHPSLFRFANLTRLRFLSPPWGGIEYKTAGDAPTNGTGGRSPKKQKQLSDYSLNSLVPYIGTDLFQLASQLSPNLAFFLPKNTSLDELSQLAPDDPVEVEEAWFGEKLKAVTVYFGGLVRTSC
jgi:hypothetical protein